MTKEEAKKVLEIMTEADDHCLYCATDLFLLFSLAFPEFYDLAKDILTRMAQEHNDPLVVDIFQNRFQDIMKDNINWR